MKDFYYILGTDANCTSTEIREAYRKLSKKFHPDLNQNDNYFAGRFREIHEAYETLIDPARRSKYDAALKKGAFDQPYWEPVKQRARSRTKSIDIAFTVTLLAIILIFGDYVYKSMHSSKAAVNTKTATVAPSSNIINHHKKKHKLKAIPKVISNDNQLPVVVKSTPPVQVIKTAGIPQPLIKTPGKSPKAASDTISSRVAKPKPAPVIAANVKHNDPTPVDVVSYRENSPNPADPYPAYIKSNATGVVYLRKADAYNSDVVAAIPSNSKVLVLEKGKSFCKISFNNKTGYVPNWTVPAR